MKLSVINDEISQDVDKVIETVKNNNFHGIELRSAWNTRPDLLTKDQLLKINRMIKTSSLEIAGFDTPCLKTKLPKSKEDFQFAREMFLQSINQARYLGATFIR